MNRTPPLHCCITYTQTLCNIVQILTNRRKEQINILTMFTIRMATSLNSPCSGATFGSRIFYPGDTWDYPNQFGWLAFCALKYTNYVSCMAAHPLEKLAMNFCQQNFHYWCILGIWFHGGIIEIWNSRCPRKIWNPHIYAMLAYPRIG